MFNKNDHACLFKYIIMAKFPFQCMSSMKRNNYRITNTAIITPMIIRTQVPTAPPTVAGLIFAEDDGIAS